MKVGELAGSSSPLANINPLNQGTDETSNDKSPSFLDYLNNALTEVDDLQKQASASAEKMAAGDQNAIHDTVIAYEKASLAMELTIEVRNRIVEAYQEIMRIQM